MKAQLQSRQGQLDALGKQLDVLTDDICMLGLDSAIDFAGYLVSLVINETPEHGQGSSASRACQIAIQDRDDPDHWGGNFVDVMRKNFTTNETKLEDLAQGWDAVRSAGMTARPQMLSEYNEQKAVGLISILERSPNHTPLITRTLQILKNRKAFLSAAPCPLHA
jgi:hypothetical protein